VPQTKTALAKTLGISRSSLYYRPKRPGRDWSLKIRIEEALHEHPSYGSRRLALELRKNRKQVQRVMQVFGIHPYRRRPKRKHYGRGSPIVPYENLLLAISFPVLPNLVWVSDFTHVVFRGMILYIATVMDLCTREILGWHALLGHPTELVLGAFTDAVRRAGTAPEILHSDQGSEYTSKRYTATLEEQRIRISMSRKGSPWENGYQESFYSQFKLDLGSPERFDSPGELVAAIAHHIHRYNHTRIHTALKMPPAAYAERHQPKVENSVT